VENIMRHLEQGLPPRQAALRGAAEIGFTVLSITISLLAVFIPILLMGGIFGRLFREFAVTLAVAVSVSLVGSPPPPPWSVPPHGAPRATRDTAGSIAPMSGCSRASCACTRSRSVGCCGGGCCGGACRCTSWSC